MLHKRSTLATLFIAAGFLTALVFSYSGAIAHSGGTDAAGCHNETATGGYHCH